MPLKDYIQFSDHLDQHRQHRRINGLEKPLHYQQIIIWILLVVFALIVFLILIPTLHTSVQPLMFGVISGLYFIHIVSHIVAVVIDPCDPNLLHMSRNVTVPEFDRSKFGHVIENGYCNLCNIYIINNKTKHCSICNKCIEKFDHHCKWLNHCIGARNYNGFIICILSALITCLIILLICSSELFLYFFNPTYLNLNSWTHSSKWIHVYHNSNSSNFDFDNFLYNTPLNDRIFLCIIFVQFVLTFIITILLLHLCVFHFYISYLGLTTYEYIKKFKSNENTLATIQAAPRSHLTESSNTINNTIYQNSLPIEENIFMYYMCYICNYRNQRKKLQVPNHTITNVNSIEITSPSHHASGWSRIKNLFRRRQEEACTDNINNNGKLTIETIENTFNQMELQNKHHKEQLRKQQKINYICKEKFLQKQAKYNHTNRKDNTLCFCLNKYYYPNYNKKNIRKVIKSCKGCKYCRKKKNAPPLNHFNGFQFWKRNKKPLNRNIEYPNVRNVQCSPNIRRNQVKPLTPNETAVFIPLKSPSDDEDRQLQHSPSSTSLPTLPPPNRKQLQNVSLKELGEAITSANNGRNGVSNSNGNSKQRKSSVSQLRSTKEPNLSPIHESGLSNPSTPHMRNQKMKINKQTGQSGLWLSVDSPLASRK